MNESLVEGFESFLETQLNEHQKAAVTHKQGGVLVIAGAGSGKTRIITARMANLILNEDAAPRSIVALTFTNKAAGEMKERLEKFLHGEYRLPFVGTFHSYCLQLLRTNSSNLAFPQFSILDSDDQIDIIRKIIKKNNLSKYTSASQLCYQISNLKNKAFGGIDQDSFTTPMVKEVYLEYEAEKTSARCFDFDDLILQVLTLFKNNQEFRTKFQKTVRHILVDEYQDTSHVQHLLLKYMALDHSQNFTIDSLCAVGDEDQSIYSWRGATVTNMLKFEQDFAPVTIVKVEQNYRSVQPILDAANTLITNNKLRNKKNLWSEKKAHNRIVAGKCRSADQEAETIAHVLKSLPAGYRLQDVAILYRTHFQSRHIEEALIHHTIPYKIIGGIRFYERKEIKDLLAYLRLIANPFDKISLMRVINCPLRGLGEKFEEQLLHEWHQNNLFDFKQLLHWMLTRKDNPIIGVKSQAIKNFLSIFEGLEQEHSPSDLIEKIIERSEYLQYLRTAFEDKEAETKTENVREFIESIAHFEYNHVNETNPDEAQGTSLEAFLNSVALLQEKITDQEQKDHVQMMTLHAAKGLEFRLVIISGMEEGLLPSNKSLNDPNDLEEERRLFYVGVTRAKEYLLLLHAGFRNTYGQIVDQVSSRFLSEIPKNLIQSVELEGMRSFEVASFLTSWFGGTPLVTRQVMTFHKPSTPPTFQRRTAPPTYLRNAPPQAIRHEKKPFVQAPAPSALNAANSTTWSKNQTVMHPTFGPGIVITVEKADGDDFYITAIFKKGGQKKILSSFLKRA